MSTLCQGQHAQYVSSSWELVLRHEANHAALLQKLSAAFASDDLEHAERVITDLRYVTRTGEAIAKKIPGG